MKYIIWTQANYLYVKSIIKSLLRARDFICIR